MAAKDTQDKFSGVEDELSCEEDKNITFRKHKAKPTEDAKPTEETEPSTHEASSGEEDGKISYVLNAIDQMIDKTYCKLIIKDIDEAEMECREQVALVRRERKEETIKELLDEIITKIITEENERNEL